MRQTPEISIVTPVLNSAAYLPQTLQSIASQSFENWEHVIVDSGSSDGSLDIISNWCASEPRARLLQNGGDGLYASVLQGFDAASGELLGWLNGDDLYTPWALDIAWQASRKEGTEWLTGFPGCWDDAGVMRFVRPYGWYPSGLIRRGWFHERLLGFLQQESIFFSRRLFLMLSADDRNEIAGCRLAGDFVLWTRLARHARLEVVPSLLSGFRRHTDNLSSGNLDAYLKEVHAHGGTFLPSPLNHMARTCFRGLSAIRALRAVESADFRLNESVASSTQASRFDY